MKLKNLLIASAALILGFSACKDSKKEVIPNAPLDTDTYMSVAMTIPQDMLRGTDDDYNKQGAYEGKDKIENLTLYIANNGAVEVKRIPVGELTIVNSNGAGTKKTLTTKSFAIKHGEVKVYAVVNITPEIQSALDAVTNAADLDATYKAAYKAFDKGVNKIAELSSDLDKMVMSGEPTTFTLVKGVTEQEAEAKTRNFVKIDVKRAAARVSVTTTATEKTPGAYEVKAKRPDGSEVVLGVLTDLTWTVAQYERTFFLQQKANAESPSYAYVPDNATYKDKAAKYYDYTQLAHKEPLKHVDAYTKDQLEKIPYKYVSETTHADNNGYRKGNTPYFLIRGVFKPATSRWADGEEALYQNGGDLFLGLSTGKFYTTEEKATQGGNAKVVTYKKGRVFYYSWVNPDVIDVTKWTKSPVRRNNIYNLNITAFRNIGLSGNPFKPTPDPDDPDDPDPDPDPDPEDPDKPDPEEPLPTPKTYMAAEVTVVDWTWHNYDYEL